MTDRSPTNVRNSRLMVRVEDGSISGLNKHVLEERGPNGRPKFIEIREGDEALMLQLPANAVRGMYTPSEDGKRWRFSLTGEKILGMEASARQAFEEGQPESREVLEERKESLRALVEDGPLPLAYAFDQLCFNPKSGDPRYTGRPDYARVVERNKEKVLEDAKMGKLRLDYQTSEPNVRAMDFVRYLAVEELRRDLVCDFLWRHAYRQIVAERWRPEYESVPQAKAEAQAEERMPADSTRAPKGKGGRRPLSNEERELALKIVALHKDSVTFDDCVERLQGPLTEMLRKKWKRGLDATFDNVQLKTDVKRLWDTGRKWKPE